MGMATMGNYIKQANRDPDIAGVVLKIDSPGGTVDGTEQFANIIKKSAKPVVAYVDGLAASAAMWIASAAREIIASSGKDEVGSVGVISQFADAQPMWEKEGVRFHRIISSQTPDKNKLFEDVRAGNYDEYRKTVLDRFASLFINTMKTNRPAVKDEQLTGKVYFAEDVMGTLVDSIGTLEDAIDRVLELAEQQEPIIHQSNNVMNQYNRINAVLGVEQLEAMDESVSLNEEQLDLIEAALAEPAVDAEMQEQLASAQADLEAAQGDLDTANATIDQLNARITELEQEPGSTPAEVVKKTDGAFSGSPIEGLSEDDVKLFNLIKR